ncbi:hypothetical protein D915_004411 [Fasciola hepatica]|uniref:Uncharacterized protein n=1 Tax=Fasciola hepatica TaxID=6192 RepID=A0A4E0RTF4_FASHE|nr:hypothetical protein D915_004411 [Fasciola hepatica]
MDELRDVRIKAQLSLLPEDAFNQLCYALRNVDVEEVCRALLMYDINEENQPQSARQCLQQLCDLPKPNACKLICSSPAFHFNAKRCAPIYEVFDRLTPLVRDVYEILTNQVLDEVYRRLGSQPDTPDPLEYTVYEMNFPNKNVVVLFWPNITLVTESNQELLLRRWTTVRENLKQNFQLIMPYPQPLANFWDLFLLNQLKQTHLVVVGPTARLFQTYAADDEHQLRNRTNEWSAEQIECAYLLDLLRGRFDQSQPNSPYQRSRPLPPVVSVIAEPDCDEAYQYCSFVYHVPRDTQCMLKYLYRIHQICYKENGTDRPK